MNDILLNMPGYASQSIVSGRGSWVTDPAGRRYFDGSSGTINVNLGHSHPSVLDAMRQQMSVRQAPRYGAATDEQAQDLAELLVRNAALPRYKVYFAIGGTGANEVAYQLACLYLTNLGMQNTRLYTSDVSYHGYTTFLLQNSGHRRRKLSLLGMVDSGKNYHAPYGLNVGAGHQCTVECADEVLKCVEDDGDGGVFMTEAISGTTGGALKPPPGYFNRLQQNVGRCRGTLIVDEVLTGLSRAGLCNTLNEVGLQKPHFLTLAKGVCCGYGNVSAILIRPDVAAVLENLDKPAPLTGTMAMSPIEIAAALAVQKELDRVTSSEAFHINTEYLRTSLDKLRELPVVEDVRGVGWYYGISVNKNRRDSILNSMKRAGLLLYPFDGRRSDGKGGGFIVAPPLNSTTDELARMLSTLSEVLHQQEDLS